MRIEQPQQGSVMSQTMAWKLKSQEQRSAESKERLEHTFVIWASIAFVMLCAGLLLKSRRIDFPSVLTVAVVIAGLVLVRQRLRERRHGTSYLCPACERTSSQAAEHDGPILCECGAEAWPTRALKWVDDEP